MSRCRYCAQEMFTESVRSCLPQMIVFDDGTELRPLSFGQEQRAGGDWVGPSGRCGDCHVVVGGYHHPGCDIEECPRCRRQLISCNCTRR